MGNRISKYDIAIEQLDRLANQLQRGLISKKDHDDQRLIVLVELAIASTKEFIKDHN